MKKVIFFAFAAFVAVTACTNEDHPVSPAGMASFARGLYYFPVLPQTFEKGFTVTAKKCAGTDDIRVVNTNVV